MATSFIVGTFLACCLCRLGSSSVQAAVVKCDSGWSEFEGNCYYFWTRPVPGAGATWYDANRACKDREANLVSFHSYAENSFVYNQMKSRSNSRNGWFWIGLMRVKGKEFTWTDGTQVDFTNWHPNLPNPFPKGTICVNQQIIGIGNTWLIGQSCSHISGAYVCKKPQRPQPCDSEPCQQGGTCVPDGSDYTCDCPPGYGGKNCEIDIDDCDGVTCQHGGTCVDKVNDYHCICPPGYTGRHCEINIDDCVGVTCENDGTCVDLVNDYKCECKPGYTGTHCEIDIDECDGVICVGDLVCVDGVNSSCCLPQ